MQTPAVDTRAVAEFVCWIVLVLTILLRLVNGPSVSTDQFVTRCLLVSIALMGVVCMRFYRIRYPRD